MLYTIPVPSGREIAALIIRWLSYVGSSTQTKRLKKSKYKHLQLTVTHISTQMTDEVQTIKKGIEAGHTNKNNNRII